MKNAIVIILFFCAKVTFSQQNIYDSLAHKFYDLNAKEESSYQVIKSDLDSLIVSSKKNYYKHKVQEIDLISGFLEDLIALRDTNWLGNYQSIYNGFDSYTDSLLERQINESQKNRILYDLEKIEFCLWNNRKNHPSGKSKYEKVENISCASHFILTTFINQSNFLKFKIINYEIIDKRKTFVFKGFDDAFFSEFKMYFANLKKEEFDFLFIKSLIIEDDIGNIFKIDKEFPLFNGYEF